VNTCKKYGVYRHKYIVLLLNKTEEGKKTTRDYEGTKRYAGKNRTTGDRWFNLALNVQGKLVIDKSERL